MNRYKIDRYQVLHMDVLQRDAYTFDTRTNNCPDIVVGDVITIEDKTYIIESLEWFNLMMNDIHGKPMRGTNVTVLIKDVICECQIGKAVKRHEPNCPYMNEMFGDAE